MPFLPAVIAPLGANQELLDKIDALVPADTPLESFEIFAAAVNEALKEVAIEIGRVAPEGSGNVIVVATYGDLPTGINIDPNSIYLADDTNIYYLWDEAGQKWEETVGPQNYIMNRGTAVQTGSAWVSGTLAAGPYHASAVGRIGVSGASAELSLSDQAGTAFVPVPTSGQRWVLRVTAGKMRLWSGSDIMVLDGTDNSVKGNLVVTGLIGSRPNGLGDNIAFIVNDADAANAARVRPMFIVLNGDKPAEFICARTTGVFKGQFGWEAATDDFTFFGGSINTPRENELLRILRSGGLKLFSVGYEVPATDGALMFRTDLQKFRAGKGGVWKNLATEDQLPAAGASIINQLAAWQPAGFAIDQGARIKLNSGGGSPITFAVYRYDDTPLFTVRDMGLTNLAGNLTIGDAANPALYPLEVYGNIAAGVPRIASGFAFGWNRSSGGGESNLVWCGGAPLLSYLSFDFKDNATNTVSSKMRLHPNGDLQLMQGMLALFPMAADPAVVNGALAFRSDTSKFRAASNGTWHNLATEDALIASRTVLVDNTHPAATDNRTGLSKYSTSSPFLTIQAGYNALGHTDTLKVCNGSYSENVSLIGAVSIFKVIYENVTHAVTTGTAIEIRANNYGSFQFKLINSAIISQDATGLAAMIAYGDGSGAVLILGDDSSYIHNSGTGPALTVQTSGAPVVRRLALYAANSFGLYAPASFVAAYDCNIQSTNAAGCYKVVPVRCYIKGATHGLQLPGNVVPSYLKAQDCYIEGTTGNAVNGGATGGPDDAEGGFMRNCIMKSDGVAVQMSAGGAFNHRLYFERCVFEITGAGTQALSVPTNGDASSVLDIYGCRSNKAMAIPGLPYQQNDLNNVVDPFTKAKYIL